MREVTRLLSDAASGDPHAAAELLPLVVYDELGKLAAAKAKRRIRDAGAGAASHWIGFGTTTCLS